MSEDQQPYDMESDDNDLQHPDDDDEEDNDDNDDEPQQDSSLLSPHQPWQLKEDGTLDTQFVAQRIVFQSALNVLLLFGASNEVCVVDANTGNTLQRVQLPGK